jgi:DNA relaxase NicK
MVWAKKNLLDLKCSRLDLAIDDYSKKLQFQQIENAIDRKNRSGFKRARAVRNHGCKFGGWTIYLGARQSEFMIRIYDKFAESKGLIDSHRWEAEIKGDTANALFPLLLSCPGSEQEYQSILIDYAIGRIKFIDAIDKNISRCPLLGWWSEWIEFLSCAPRAIFVARFKPSLARTKQWLQKSVAKSLAMISESLGVYYFPHFVEELLRSGKERMKNIDELRVTDYVEYSHSHGNNMSAIRIELVN